MSHLGGQAASYYSDYNNAPPQGHGAPQNYGQPPPSGPQNNGYQQSGNYQEMQPPQQPMDYQDPNKYSQPAPNYQPPQDSKQGFEQTFQIQKPKFHDWWAGLLLIATFLGFVAVSGLSLYRYSKYHKFNGGGVYGGSNDFSLDTNTILLFVIVLGIAFVFSALYLMLARMFTKLFVWITGILNCVFAVATAVYYLYLKLWGAGIVFAIFAVFAIICFISWIPRIPFAVVMLQQTMDVARMPRVHVLMISLMGGIVAAAFAAWWSVTLVAIYTAYMPSSSGVNNPSCSDAGCSSGKVIGLVVFVTFAGYWISEWIKNTIHTSVAGVYGSWYFCAGKPGGIPKGSSWGAFKRATTYSFGSVSLGSLFIALLNMIRQALSVLRSQAGQDGSLMGTILFCVLGCIVSLVQWAVEFINKYAFCHIALYGKGYFEAAKDTWTMIKNRGIDALVNDCLVGPVLSMGALFVAYLCTLFSYLYLEYTKPAYNEGRTFTPVIMAFSFLIGLQVCQIFTEPIASGVNTIFVAMGWDPQVAVTDHPEFWNKLVQVYPHVQNVIHA
ncbi:Protein pns1 [Cyphellophora attinorum]|uniref:Protein PNS1 n=1 Tax=Cyphellophora attinorum TaxID=1664694 RepID=A0A0N0NMV7_9EURO|nr:Protein pns1 [Phialophora attinorum]KPI40659.1 Protein pns1 [Phialophora attinorum]